MGSPIPKMRQVIIVRTSASGNDPPDNITTRVENFKPTPVSVIIPIIIPATPQARATGITALEAETHVSIMRRGVSAVALSK